jgi:hypothetical protein
VSHFDDVPSHIEFELEGELLSRASRVGSLIVNPRNLISVRIRPLSVLVRYSGDQSGWEQNFDVNPHTTGESICASLQDRFPIGDKLTLKYTGRVLTKEPIHSVNPDLEPLTLKSTPRVIILQFHFSYERKRYPLDLTVPAQLGDIKLSNFSFSRLIDFRATLTVKAGVDYCYYCAPEIYDADLEKEYRVFNPPLIMSVSR